MPIPAPSAPGEVGDAIAVGTGISVGEEGGGAEPSNSAEAGMYSRGAMGAAIPGTSAGSISGIGDVGDGLSVGTGISVGDDGAATARLGGTGAIVAKSIVAATAVGTGISVGEWTSSLRVSVGPLVGTDRVSSSLV